MQNHLDRSLICGWLAIGAVTYHAFAMLALHRLVPEVNPLTDMVGAYLASPHQLLSRTTFLALGCLLACLALGLFGRVAATVWTRLSAVLLVLATVGFVGVALAPHAAQLFAVSTQPATVGSILLLSIALRREPGWQSVGGILVAIGVGLVTLFVSTIVLGIVVAMGLGGLANRVVLVLIYSWALLVARGLVNREDVGATE